MSICPNTSVSFDCRGCSLFGRSSRLKQLKEQMKEVIYVYEGGAAGDEEMCVLGPGNMEAAQTLTDVEATKEWDCLVLNRHRKVVTIRGPRFLGDRDPMTACEKVLEEVLSGNMLRVVSNIVDWVLSGKSQQRPINTMYGRTALTMQAFTLKNGADVAGTCVIVRPTQYRNADVLRMFTSSDQADDSSDDSLPLTPPSV